MIPNKIFFCFGFAPEPQEFLFVHFLAVLSAARVNKVLPTIYYHREPTGEWWKETNYYADHVQVTPPTEIFGKPLLHYAHQADVFRLQKLKEHGGIYLDIDTLCLKPFTPLLAVNAMVMGMQSKNGHDYGLCNAVIMAAANSRCLAAWFDAYKDFRGKGRNVYWDEHSVKVPYRMWLDERCDQENIDITVVPPYYFFYPDFNHTEQLLTCTDISGFKNSYCTHLWEQMCMDQLKLITPETLFKSHNAYSKLVSNLPGEDF